MDVTNDSAASPAIPAPAVAPHAGITFHDVLSALNPLQYLPVVGTIYRAVTGDVIAEPVRMFGSLAVSALMGGPVGVLINLATTAVEKLAGVDPDQVAHRALAAIGLADPGPEQVAKVWTYPAAEEAEAGDVAEPTRWRQATEAYGRAQESALGAVTPAGDAP